MSRELLYRIQRFFSREEWIKATMVEIMTHDALAKAEQEEKQQRQDFRDHPEIAYLLQFRNEQEFKMVVAQLQGLIRTKQIKHTHGADYAHLKVLLPEFPAQRALQLDINWYQHQGDDRSDSEEYSLRIDLACTVNQKRNDGTIILDLTVEVRKGKYVVDKHPPVRTFTSWIEFASAVTACVESQSLDPLTQLDF